MKFTEVISKSIINNKATPIIKREDVLKKKGLNVVEGNSLMAHRAIVGLSLHPLGGSYLSMCD